jgi:hypothetical protein
VKEYESRTESSQEAYGEQSPGQGAGSSDEKGSWGAEAEETLKKQFGSLVFISEGAIT